MLLCNNLVPISRRGHRFRRLLGGIHIKLNVRFWGEIDIRLTPSPAPFHRFLVCTALNGINLVPTSGQGFRLRGFLGRIYTRVNVGSQGKIDILLTPSLFNRLLVCTALNGINLVPTSRQSYRLRGFLGGIYTRIDVRSQGKIDILLTPSLFNRLLVYSSLDGINLGLTVLKN